MPTIKELPEIEIEPDYQAKYEALVKACEPVLKTLAEYEKTFSSSTTSNEMFFKTNDIRAIREAIGDQDERA